MQLFSGFFLRLRGYVLILTVKFPVFDQPYFMNRHFILKSNVPYHLAFPFT